MTYQVQIQTGAQSFKTILVQAHSIGEASIKARGYGIVVSVKTATIEAVRAHASAWMAKQDPTKNLPTREEA